MALDQNLIDEQVREYRKRVDQFIKELDEIANKIQEHDTAGELTPELRDLFIEFHQKKIAMMEESIKSYDSIRVLITDETGDDELKAQEAEMKAAIELEKAELAKYQI